MGQHADDALHAALIDHFAFEDFTDGYLSPQEAYERGLIDEAGRFETPVLFEDVLRSLAAQRNRFLEANRNDEEACLLAKAKISTKRRKLKKWDNLKTN